MCVCVCVYKYIERVFRLTCAPERGVVFGREGRQKFSQRSLVFRLSPSLYCWGSWQAQHRAICVHAWVCVFVYDYLCVGQKCMSPWQPFWLPVTPRVWLCVRQCLKQKQIKEKFNEGNHKRAVRQWKEYVEGLIGSKYVGIEDEK